MYGTREMLSPAWLVFAKYQGYRFGLWTLWSACRSGCAYGRRRASSGATRQGMCLGTGEVSVCRQAVQAICLGAARDDGRFEGARRHEPDEIEGKLGAGARLE